MEKIKILKTVIIMAIKSIKNNKAIEDIDYININKSTKNNPYFKAFNLLKNIIDNLTEDSRLFEPLLYFDSGTITNYLYWVGEDFHKLEEIVLNNIEILKKKNI